MSQASKIGFDINILPDFPAEMAHHFVHPENRKRYKRILEEPGWIVAQTFQSQDHRRSRWLALAL
jgi:spermidine synthase